MADNYIDDWCYKQNDREDLDSCTAPIINGVPLCQHIQPEKES